MNKIVLLGIWLCLWTGNILAQNHQQAMESKDSPVLLGQPMRTLPAAEFEKLIADTTVQLVDVRTLGEYKAGHIAGAKNIDVQAVGFDQAIDKLDRMRPVAVYCRSGVRSKTAVAKLEQKGFKVFELEKGINSWTGKITR